MKKIFISVFAVALIVPQVAFASWWNPATWNIWHIFSKNSMVEPIASDADLGKSKNNTEESNQENFSDTTVSEIGKLKKEIEELKKKQNVAQSALKQPTANLETNKGTNLPTPATQKIEEKKNNIVTFPNGNSAEIDTNGNVVRWIKEAIPVATQNTINTTPVPQSDLLMLRNKLDEIGLKLDSKNASINYYLSKNTCVGLSETQYSYCVEYAFNPTFQPKLDDSKKAEQEKIIQQWMKDNAFDFSVVTYKSQFNALVSSYGFYQMVLP